jgi:hypothetical protein
MKIPYIVYDLEIIKAIPGKGLIEGIQYCSGWRDYEGMGISVIGYQWWDKEPSHCLSAERFLDELNHPDRPEDFVMIGFSNKSFDDKLLAAHGVHGTLHRYDLLEEVRIAAGFKAHFQSVLKGYSYKLDKIAQANGTAKTGSGELAPILWQQGKRQDVIDYCQMDVTITTQMLKLGFAGELIDPNTGKKLQLRSIEQLFGSEFPNASNL